MITLLRMLFTRGKSDGSKSIISEKYKKVNQNANGEETVGCRPYPFRSDDMPCRISADESVGVPDRPRLGYRACHDVRYKTLSHRHPPVL